MPKVSLINLKVLDTNLDEFTGLLSRYFGYQETVFDANQNVIQNPESTDKFVKRKLTEEIKSMIRQQKLIESSSSYNPDVTA